MQIKLKTIPLSHKDQLKTMLLEYFTEIDKSKIIQKENHETINYPYLEDYWIALNRIPLKILWDNKIVGFILINDWIVCKSFNAKRSIAEFYIRPNYRRKGIGQQVAFKVFDTFRGKWEVRQSATNFSAIQFWQTVIAAFTKGNFKELKQERQGKIEFIQLFES